uniref:CCHC-type domain-containing protein n=1 Tax=Trichogramma kaykai TaxID=54128 RepID=A0ABD2WIS4_9HYME
MKQQSPLQQSEFGQLEQDKVCAPDPTKEIESETENTNGRPSHRWIPTKSIVCTFEGQYFPDKVYVWGVSVEVEPYVQNIMQCYKCFKFQHTTKTCRGSQICFNCGETQHTGEACKFLTPHCANCTSDQANHVSVSSKCPKIIEQKKINNLMAYKNLSCFEAKALVTHNKSNAMGENSLSGILSNQFPRLTPKPTSTTSGEKTYASATTIKTVNPSTSNKTYSKELSNAISLTQHNDKSAYQNKTQQQQFQYLQQQQHYEQQQQQQKLQQQQQKIQQQQQKHEQQQLNQLQIFNFNEDNDMDGLSQIENLNPSQTTLQNNTQKLYNRIYNNNQESSETKNSGTKTTKKSDARKNKNGSLRET